MLLINVENARQIPRTGGLFKSLYFEQLCRTLFHEENIVIVTD